ncbi:MAG TPA: DctP family TRAP transporter solute-binding subunit [Kineosporiaceae bacterium]|nr:DctP family TRAP transporter solute-binding subunit [Kineosporiaceae bacterium]
MSPVRAMSPARTRGSLTLAACAAVPLLMLTACGDDNAGSASDGKVEITLAHSYTDAQPQHRCGAKVIADEMAKADVGVTVQVFSGSQLGGDADRIGSVVSGDIDMDIQGASALGAIYEPVSALDAAYAFDDADHLARYFDSKAATDLIEDFATQTGVRTLGAWSAGMRQFTANKPIRTPADLTGLRMRFPNSAQFLMNAKALGASPVEVAYEELFLALQQGTVDGQENPIVNIAALSLDEVQDYLSLSAHQANSNLVIIGKVWKELSTEQQQALRKAVEAATDQVPGCVAEEEQKKLAEWKAGKDLKIVEDVDVEAFRTRADTYLRSNFKPAQLKVYEGIRAAAQ